MDEKKDSLGLNLSSETVPPRVAAAYLMGLPADEARRRLDDLPANHRPIVETYLDIRDQWGDFYRRAKAEGIRFCCIRGCVRVIPQGRVLCSSHWKKTPEGLRRELTSAWLKRDRERYKKALRRLRTEVTA